MSNKKQTAVEYLFKNLSIALLYNSPSPELSKIIQQAKAMEKEQIQEAFKQGYECNEVDEIFEIKETMFTAEEYYNKKYRGDTIQNTKETIEQASERMYPNKPYATGDKGIMYDEFAKQRIGFIEGAKWQADKMYSEEDIIKIVEKSRTTGLTAEYLIEQFKHKHIG